MFFFFFWTSQALLLGCNLFSLTVSLTKLNPARNYTQERAQSMWWRWVGRMVESESQILRTETLQTKAVYAGWWNRVFAKSCLIHWLVQWAASYSELNTLVLNWMFLYYLACYHACLDLLWLQQHPREVFLAEYSWLPIGLQSPSRLARSKSPSLLSESFAFLSEFHFWMSGLNLGVCHWAVERARQSWILCVLNTTLFHYVLFPLWGGG